MHVPILPSKPAWETPIAASREIVEAITDAADSAVDAATSAVRSARRRTFRRRKPVPWRWVAVVLLGLAAVAAIRRRRSASPPVVGGRTDPEGVGRSDAPRTDGQLRENGAHLLAGTDQVSVVD